MLRDTVSSSNWTLNLSLSPGTWYWKVVAKNSTGSTEGDTWSFTIEELIPPGNFDNVSPSDGQQYPPGTQPTSLDWEDSQGAISYDVYLYAEVTIPEQQPIATVTSSFWQLNLSLLSGTWNWKIVAKNSAGSTEGVNWSFIIRYSVVLT